MGTEKRLPEEEEEEMNVDTMLKKAGDFGRYQYMLMVLFGFINIISGFHYFGQSFIINQPEFHCSKDGDEDDLNNSTCYKKVTNSSGIFEESCSEYIFSDPYGYVSIIEELKWVCKDNWKPTIGQSVFFIGSVIGSLGFGVLADHIGRLHVLVISNLLALMGNLSTLLTTNVIVFCISRFLAGGATDANFVMMYIIVMEYMRPSMRTIGLNLCIGIFYCLSCVAVPWIAVLAGHWKTFLLIVAAPHALIVLFYLMVPESAQWLLSVKKTEKAIVCFERVARINGKSLSKKDVEAFRQYATKNVNSTYNENLFALFKTPKLRKKTSILIFKSMVVCLCYDAISRNINGFGYSSFMIFSLTSLTILPGCAFILLVQDRIGRKALSSTSLFICGIFTAITSIVQAYGLSSTVVPIFVILSRFCVIVAYNSSAQYAVELIPTVVRGQGVSAIHVSGYLVTFFSPQVLYLENIWTPLPEIVLGILLFLGAVACLFLPETLNRTLPITLEDGENFGEDEKIFEFACCKKNISESTLTLTKKP